jgi:large subunit ribosomal protein L15
MRLHNLAPRPGAKHRTKRLGIGESSGHGKTSGKGHKGQNSRSGGSIRIGFEGGQMPMHRRLPKKGFNNSSFAFHWAIVNLTDLELHFADGAVINEDALREKKLVKGGAWDGVKILGVGEITKKLTVQVDRASASAKEKIEKAGGTLTLNPLKTAAQPAEKA